MTREMFKIGSSKYISIFQITNIGCACSVGQISEVYTVTDIHRFYFGHAQIVTP